MSPATRERPIPFSAPMVRAILEGRKTQTRRVMKSQPYKQAQRLVPHGEEWLQVLLSGDGEEFVLGNIHQRSKCPYGVPGDQLWVREGVITHVSIPQLFGYVADGCRATEPWLRQRTARYMPRWASRITLEITDVRVERVQDISEDDAEAEGAGWCDLCHNSNTNFLGDDTCPRNCGQLSFREEFQKLWDSINAKKHPWSSNPWVWALPFKVVKP